MKALAIRQPWATLIIHCGKDIENRCWPTRFRGPVLIHAAKGMTNGEWEDAVYYAAEIFKPLPAEKRQELMLLLKRDELPRGGIIGSAVITGCVQEHASPWFMGENGFVLASAKPLPFRPFKGALGFFDVPAES
ncbi:MAG: ASCH domain-containing protein [Pseudomonadota bacterium]